MLESLQNTVFIQRPATVIEKQKQSDLYADDYIQQHSNLGKRSEA